MAAFGYFEAGSTPEQLKRRREELDYLAGTMGRNQTYGGGVGDLIKGVVGGIARHKVNKTEKSGTDAALSKWSAFNPFAPPQNSTAIAQPASFGADSASPQQSPVAASKAPSGDVSAQIYRGLVQRGLPDHVARAAMGNMAVESRLDPGINEQNPLVAGSRGGFGLNQWTGPRRRAFEAYAKSKGVAPNDLNAQLDFTMQELKGPEKRAFDRLMATKTPEEAAAVYSQSFLRPGIPHLDRRLAETRKFAGMDFGNQQPVQVASNDPGFMPQPASFQQPQQPTPEMQPPQQMAQAAQQGGDDERLQQLWELSNNAFLPDDKKAMARSLLEQEMKKRDPAYQMQMQQDQMGIEKSRLELEQMRNPQADPLKQVQLEQERIKLQQMQNPAPPKPEYQFIPGKDGSMFLGDKTAGTLRTLYGSQPDPVKPTADIQEYEYARQQGFKGTFPEYQTAIKKAGASQVNIDQKAEGAFDKKLAEGQAETFNTMATEGMNARADLAVLGELGNLMQGQGGAMTGLSGALAKYGIGGEGVSDIQAAQALINKLVPTQRQPGSGSMSDRDVELFTRSLPSLWNSPGGNQKIMNVMQGLAKYKQAQGEIAQAVQMGQMSRQDAVAALKAIPNPLAEFGATQQEQAAQGTPAVGTIVDGYRFKGGDPADEKNWEAVN